MLSEDETVAEWYASRERCIPTQVHYCNFYIIKQDSSDLHNTYITPDVFKFRL